MLPRFVLASSLVIVSTWGCSGGGGNGSLTHDPAVPTADGRSNPGDADVPTGDSFYALFNTSKGNVIVEVNPDWAPVGAQRFKELVNASFYDDCRFFRVIEGFMVQVGMNGDPAVGAMWADSQMVDDPVLVSNTRGRVTFAKTGLPNSRTTQIFFNYGDNSQLDGQGFAPFGEVIEGMEVLESLYGGYGEGAPNGAGPSQDLIRTRGNEYLIASFPKLDHIETARIYETEEAARAALSGSSEPAGDAATTSDAADETPGEETTANE